SLAPGTSESFETMQAVPQDWKVLEYQPGATKILLKRGRASDGKQYVRLASDEPNHTRLLVPAAVEPGATYRFSAMVRGEGPDAGAPVSALLALDGSDSNTTKAITGDGEWREQELYVRTGKTEQVQLALSLGWFGNTVAGTADFDELELEKVSAVPDGATVAEAKDFVEPVVEKRGPNELMLPLAGVMLVLIAGCWRLLARGGKRVD
ncbi:MAG: hypothetical protein ACK4N5_24810, partial [Myxococcales bacterium]